MRSPAPVSLLLPSLLSLLLRICSLPLAAQTVIPLWPEGAPCRMLPPSEATLKSIANVAPKGGNSETHITEPTLTIYPAAQPNGAAVIVAPGGGFWFLSVRNEGTLVCEWLNQLGVTAALLRYRVPTRDNSPPYELPVQDAQRALGLLRSRSKEFGIDPARVGVLGFSAGANLVGHLSWDRTARNYPQKEGVDDPRGPDFTVFIYGGGFLNSEDPTKFREGFSIPKDACPAFFTVAHDDRNNPLEAAKLYLEFKKLQRPAELHIYASGGHGYGMSRKNTPAGLWFESCGEWMGAMGFLKPAQ
jgi:acetyl esterase/lipase